MKIHHKVDVTPLRAAAYPAIGDALDAIMKGFAALIAQDVSLPKETQEWVQQCQAVKAAHPKSD